MGIESNVTWERKELAETILKIGIIIEMLAFNIILRRQRLQDLKEVLFKKMFKARSKLGFIWF